MEDTIRRVKYVKIEGLEFSLTIDTVEIRERERRGERGKN